MFNLMIIRRRKNTIVDENTNEIGFHLFTSSEKIRK